MSVIKKIQAKLGLEPELFLTHSDQEIQLLLADTLRKAAIKEMRESEMFRTEYINANDDERPASVDCFLNIREQDGVWAGQEEAAALGRILDCTVELTDINIRRNKAERTQVHYPHRSRTKHAKTIHLQINNNEGHFSLLNQETEADGNCLYHAFAQFIQQEVIREHEVIESQKAAFAKFSHFRPNTPDEAEREATRLAALTDEELDEIQRNYDAAVAFAEEETAYCKH